MENEKPNQLGDYQQLVAHPLAALMPSMTDDELGQLKVDIKMKGVLQPLVLYEGKILDGRSRYLGGNLVDHRWVAEDFVEFTDLGMRCTPEEYVWSANLERRHLTPTQRLALSSVWVEHVLALAQAHQKAQGGATPQPLSEKAPKVDTRAELAAHAQAPEALAQDFLNVKKFLPEAILTLAQGTKTLADVKPAVEEARRAAGKARKGGGRIASYLRRGRKIYPKLDLWLALQVDKVDFVIGGREEQLKQDLPNVLRSLAVIIEDNPDFFVGDTPETVASRAKTKAEAKAAQAEAKAAKAAAKAEAKAAKAAAKAEAKAVKAAAKAVAKAEAKADKAATKAEAKAAKAAARRSYREFLDTLAFVVTAGNGVVDPGDVLTHRQQQQYLKYGGFTMRPYESGEEVQMRDDGIAHLCPAPEKTAPGGADPIARALLGSAYATKPATPSAPPSPPHVESWLDGLAEAYQSDKNRGYNIDPCQRAEISHPRANPDREIELD